MTGNKAVVYKGKGNVAVEDIGYPELILRDGPGVPKANVNRKCEHGVILKVITTNICGSDQHMVRAAQRRQKAWCSGMKLREKSLKRGVMLNLSKKATSYPFLSILPADAV